MTDFMGKYFQEQAIEIHVWAKEKGWWDEKRDHPTLIELIHSEISEATEEIRDGKPSIYQINIVQKMSDPLPRSQIIKFGYKDWIGERKPEGQLIELADMVIRILDTLCYLKVDIADCWDSALAAVVIQRYPNELCFHIALRKILSRGLAGTSIFTTPLVEVLAMTVKYFRMQRLIDIREIIAMKMEYNKTRPYRHGGKKF